MSAEKVTYLDSSAIVKLVVREPESSALRQYLCRHRTVVTSALARAELHRAVFAFGARAQKTCDEVLARFELLRVNDRVLRAAGSLEPAGLQTLDAIHLASAAALEDSIASFVCYDVRLAAAARAHGWSVAAPA